jgi:hypothetical protein
MIYDEMNHILFEIDERFGELIAFNKVWLSNNDDFTEHNRFLAKERFRWTINDLLSYTRALRDKLNEVKEYIPKDDNGDMI